MKVLKDNYHNEENINSVKRYPRKRICECCGSELEYEKADTNIGAFGCVYIICPLCGADNFIDDGENELTLTRDNVEFPTHFWHTSTETGAVDCCNNEEIKKHICEAIKYFRANKEESHWFTASGNLYVDVSRFDGDECYDVVVTKDYYETSIPFEAADY